MSDKIVGANCTSQSLSTGSGNTNNMVQFGQKLYHGEGHQMILESHDDSARNAFIYVGLILFVYLLAVVVIVIRYLVMRSNRDFMSFTGFQPLTAPTVVVSPHDVICIETIETQHKVLQETEL